VACRVQDTAAMKQRSLYEQAPQVKPRGSVIGGRVAAIATPAPPPPPARVGRPRAQLAKRSAPAARAHLNTRIDPDLELDLLLANSFQGIPSKQRMRRAPIAAALDSSTWVSEREIQVVGAHAESTTLPRKTTASIAEEEQTLLWMKSIPPEPMKHARQLRSLLILCAAFAALAAVAFKMQHGLSAEATGSVKDFASTVLHPATQGSLASTLVRNAPADLRTLRASQPVAAVAPVVMDTTPSAAPVARAVASPVALPKVVRAAAPARAAKEAKEAKSEAKPELAVAKTEPAAKPVAAALAPKTAAAKPAREDRKASAAGTEDVSQSQKVAAAANQAIGNSL
jgi:hypothetical protein